MSQDDGANQSRARSSGGAAERSRPAVSVVVPAYDAEQTLAVALASLQRQTLREWEAIVVDDGSTDATAAVVEERAESDPRLRLVRQANGGVSSARNAGVALARAEWLVFLDADDWLAPEALATLRSGLDERPQLDGVHCGWTRIAPDGRRVEEICPRDEEDMFSWHAHNCGFAIHAVMVRRELVVRAGGFDPALVTCEDWDLWLRLSRLGARWGRLDAQLAHYRMRELSASMDSARLLDDGLAVIDRAHGPDERLAGQPHPRAAGEAEHQRSRARLVHAVYAAALALGHGHDAVALLDRVADDRCVELGSDQVAYALFEGVPLGAGTVPADWPSFSADLADRVWRFLEQLERISGAPELALRTKRMLERLVVEARPPAVERAASSLFGRIATVSVDLERPLADLDARAGAERLFIQPRYGSLELPRVELPVCDGRVTAALVADAVADRHAWMLLGELFAATLLPRLEIATSDGRVVVERAGQRLADEPLSTERPLAGLVHDFAGWELLLQELCGDPGLSNAAVYDEAHDERLQPAGRVATSDGWAAIELAAPIPELSGERPIRVVATIGGATIAAVPVTPSNGRVAAGALRRAICAEAGFELCRLAVRQGVIGRLLDDAAPLRDRLLDARARAGRESSARASLEAVAPDGVELAPGWRDRAICVRDDDAFYAIARRRDALTGLSGSRVAAIPAAAARAAVAAARAAGDPVIAVGDPGANAPAAYAPDVVWHADRSPEVAAAAASAATDPTLPGPGREYFESLFAAGADPWQYTSDYERGKYDQTLSLVPRPAPQRALELACAEGHFTRQLASRVEQLVASDFSTIALERARARCADVANVTFGHHDLFADAIEGSYDLIVCSEVLYYAGSRPRLDHAARTIAAALARDGTLLTAHANLLADDPGRPGFDWDEIPFGARTIGVALQAAGLELTQELANPLYRVQAYRRRQRRVRSRRARVERAEAPLPAVLPRDVEARFHWEGGRAPGAATDPGPVTWELPILMYHRVAPTGSELLREWRVTPDQLERQLDYLRAAGFRSASFGEWRIAAEGHRALPGRRVMLTFDDGYEDFAEHAYPLLREYGFDATVFLVSDRVGQTNDWDRGYGETVALMDWDTIKGLDGHGVEFGGHSASHPMLTALGVEEVVREASRCRAELVGQLGHVVRTFAYPYGDIDAAVARAVGGCGFEFGVTTAEFKASAAVPMLELPRINVPGTGSFEAFVRMLAERG